MYTDRIDLAVDPLFDPSSNLEEKIAKQMLVRRNLE